MRYALVENGQITQGPKALPRSWQHISGLDLMTNAELAQIGWLPWRFVGTPKPSEDSISVPPIIEITAHEIVETQSWRAKTVQELEGERLSIITNRRENRYQAYLMESDPLFFQAQRGEISMDVWLQKVQEIRDRYP